MEDLIYRRVLHVFAQIEHDKHLVCYLGNDCQIMCDDNKGHVQLFLKVFDEIQDLGLDRHINCRGRLISNKADWADRKEP